jgi:hypothetical protein
LRVSAFVGYIAAMTDQNLPHEIEIYQVGQRRLYAKTRGGNFAIFEDDLTPEELIAIAKDIAARRPDARKTLSLAPYGAS